MVKEIRNNDTINSTSESRTIEGYGIVFDSESVDLGGFTEIIMPDAITAETIAQSDILFLLDHNKERGILARSKNGKGSLQLEIDEKGLKYTFEAPQTALGEEVLEGLRRGDISKCSFAFVVAEDRWVKSSDGKVLRYIDKIKQLYDISIVYNPAYEDTIVVNKRGLEDMEKEEINEVKEVRESEEKEPQKEEEKEVENETKEEEPKEEEAENSEEEKEEKEGQCEGKEDEKRNLKENNLYNKSDNIINNMNKKFSLVGAVRDIVNHRNLDEVTANVIKEGRNAADKSGIAANGQIVLAVEQRAEGDTPSTSTITANGLMATEATYGKEAVPTDTWDIIGALHDRMVLAEAGAQFITAQGNIDIPVYDGSSVYWESEIGEAQDGAGKFSKVTLSPKRLTAFVDLSKQLLNQTSASVEQMIREDLINAVAEKLQKTVLGNGAGSATEPTGLFNGVTADTAAFAYDDAVNMEAVLEGANVYGDYKYIVNPMAKAVLRTTSMDKGSGKFVYENNEILGVGALSTNSVVNKGVIIGDFKQMVIANFGALDITVDEVSRAAYGQIRLVVNFYVDYAVKRPSAFVKRILK